MIILSSTYLDFGSLSADSIVNKVVTIYNDDAMSSVNVTNIVSSSPDYEIAPLSFSIDAGSFKNITIKYTASTSLSATGTITVSYDAGPDEIINVTANVLEPTVSIDTSSINFNKLSVGDTLTIVKQITNTAINGSTLTVSISHSNSNFSLAQTSFELLSGATANISITFNPTSIGSKSDTIEIFTNDSIGYYSFGVSGLASIPSYSLSTSTLSYGSVPINDPTSLSFTLTNTDADVNLVVTSVASDNVEITSDINSVKILPMQSQLFTITFTPLSLVVISGNLTLSTNAGSIVVNYSGVGLAVPVLQFSTTAINLGIYSLNIPQIVTINIRNIGIVDAVLSNIVFPTVAGTTFTVPISYPYVISYGTDLSLQININSISEIIFSDNIIVQSNSYNNPHNISISGEAQSPEIQLNTYTLDFGTVQIGEQKKLSFTITNTKSVDLAVTIQDVLNFQIVPNSLTVSANSSTVVDVTFLSNVEGSITNSLIMQTNDIAHPVEVINLIAIASVDYALRVIPDVIKNDFLTKDIATTTEISIINRSVFSAAIDSFDVTDLSGVTTYTITASGLPATLLPGESVSIIVSILCTGIGKVSSHLKFNARVGELLQYPAVAIVQYDGFVYSPTISLSTNSMNFAQVAVGISEIQEFVVTNASNDADLNVSITSNNDVFHFKSQYNENATITYSDTDAKYIATVKNKPIMLDSITVVDSLTGEQYTLGDPINSTQFSVNTDNGILTFNVYAKNKTLTITYDNKLTSFNTIINKKSLSTISLVFSPKQIGIQNGIITIQSNDVVNPLLTINVTGEGIANITSLTRTTDVVKFIAKVNSFVTQKIRLKNTGTVKLYVTDVTISLPFSSLSHQFSIDPNETYDFDVSFYASDDSLVNQTIIIHSNAPDLSINVSGQGEYPVMELPTSFIFDDTALNTTASKTLTISNTSNVDLVVELKLTSQYFSIMPTSMTVLANNSYNVNVMFRPIQVITYVDVIKVISDDPLNSQVDFVITGKGVNKPVIEVASKLEFDKTNVRESSQRMLEVFNNGSDTLNITNVVITDNLTSFSVASSTSISIAPQSSSQITVIFSPKSAPKDYIRGSLRITCNDTAHNIVDVLLKGVGYQPDGEWISFNLQDMIPDALLSVANGVNSVITPLKVILNLIKQVMNLVKVFLVDSSSALKAILQQIYNLIDKYVQDLGASGLYLLPVFPNVNYYDVNNNSSKFAKFLASVGGGSEVFKQKVVNSFDDIFDTKRPQFSDNGECAAFVIAVDSGNIATIVKGIIALKKIFTSLDWEPDVQEPQSVQAMSGTEITIRWDLPEVVEFNVAGIFNQQKFVDMIYGFEVYRSEKQSTLVTASQDYYDSNNQIVYRKGDVIDILINDKVEPKGTVKATAFFKSVKDFAVGFKPNGKQPISSIGYSFKDAGATEGKSYFYSVRTLMNSDGPYSSLSNEVVATKTKPETIVAGQEFLNRCANFRCNRVKEKTKQSMTLPEPKVKLIETSGLVIQSRSLFTSNKVVADATKQQVNNFTVTINSIKIDISNLTVRNVTETERRITDDKLKIDVKKFYDPDNGVMIWDDSNDQADGKNQYFEILNETKLVAGWDLLVAYNNDNTILTISDISNIGYKSGDIIVVEYYLNEYKAACIKGMNVFNETKCNDGTIKQVCPLYSNARCAYHGGTQCLNVGNTNTGGRCIPNITFFDAYRCQDASVGGLVSIVNRPYTNDASYCIETTGICAGYRSFSEDTLGPYPNWSSINAQALIKPIEAFIEVLKKWVDRELAGIQSGSDTVAQFIDLLAKKIEELEKVIDTIQQIVETITSIFSSDVGFHILMIEPGSGGSERIKRLIQTAEGGPSSGSDGYTAGLVMLIGGPELKAIYQFLQLFFKK